VRIFSRTRDRRVLPLAAALAVVVCALTGCGSRLPYEKVLAENAALGHSSGTGVGTGSDQDGSANVGSASASDTTPGQTPSSSQAASTTTSTAAGSSTAHSSTGATSASTAAAPCTGPATGSTINIGQMGSDSGVIGTLTESARTAAEVWANYVNQHGGLDCHKVNLISVDDGGSPSTALSEAQTLIQQDHVIAFMGNVDVLATPTLSPYFEQVKVPVIGGSLTENQWYTNPYFFPQGGSVRVATDDAIETQIQAGHTNVGVVACVEFALICSNITNVLENDTASLGGKLVYNASASVAQPDFTSECLAAQQAGVTALFLALDPASIDRFVDDCAAQNYHPAFVTNSVTFIPSILSTANADGLSSTGAVFPFTDVSPATAQFDQAIQQATGAAPISELEALTWVAGLVLQAASVNLPASNPTSADILAGLYQIKNDTFGGLTVPITYTTGQPTLSPTCSFVLDIGKGAFTAPNGLQPQCISSSYAPQLP
jgi:branched-chain amino acid transport system substrate-binding protein